MTNEFRLRSAMLRSKIKVTELCEKCGFSTGYFYKCVNGEQDFRSNEIIKICEVLGIGADEMNLIFFAPIVDESSRKEG